MKIDPADLKLSAAQLDDKYNPEGNGQHPVITRMDWMIAVVNGETLVGYWDWIQHQLELDHEAWES